jgi:tripartite-type tricarboxylate transporter receptor subunit TctC
MHTARLMATLVAGAMACGCSTTFAQSYPIKPVRVICTGVGGGADIAARLLFPGMSAAMGQQFVIDNRASGLIPGEVASKMAPDGYNMLFYNNTVWVGPLFQKAGYDAVRDFVPVTLAARSPNILVIHPSLPVKTVRQLIALANAKPGQLNYATGSAGASNHVAAELFKSMSKVDIVRIPYKNGSLESASLLSGEVQIMFASASMTPYINAGRLRALAVTSTAPSPLFPGLPTVASAGLPGYESGSFYVFLAPAGTSPAVISRLAEESVKVLRTAEVRERYLRAGMEAVGSTPQELAALIHSDIARLTRLIKETGIKDE